LIRNNTIKDFNKSYLFSF